jgi:hypothetical protein
MVLFQRSDDEGEWVDPRPRRARREKVPKRQIRTRRNLEWHRLRYIVGLSVWEIAGIYRVSEPTVRAGLVAAAEAIAAKVAEDRAEDPDD